MTFGMSRRAHAYAALGATLLTFVLAECMDGTPPRSPERIMVCVLVLVSGSLYGTFLTRGDA